VIAGQNAVQQRRLASAEKAGEHRQGDRRRFGTVNGLHSRSIPLQRPAALQ